MMMGLTAYGQAEPSGTQDETKLPALITGSLSDIYKVGVKLKESGIQYDTTYDTRKWISPDAYGKYANLYIGEHLISSEYKELAENNGWNGDDIGKVRKYVENGGTIILTGDVLKTLGGGKTVLEKDLAGLLGFSEFNGFDTNKYTAFKFLDGSIAQNCGIPMEIKEWLRNSSMTPGKVTTAKVLGAFTGGGENLSALTLNLVGKGKVYYMVPSMHRVAGNGEISLGFINKARKCCPR
jgi:hypothetical protein